MLGNLERNLVFTESGAAPAGSKEDDSGKKTTKKRTSKKADSVTVGPSVDIDEVCERFVEETAFFEDSIVREQVF